MRTKAFWVVIFIVLVGISLLFAGLYFEANKELESTKVVISSQRYSGKYLNFLKMFVKLVIKSEKEVDFDTRLKLENSVRELEDADVLAMWQKFVASQNESEAQKNVKELLAVLVEKIYIK